MVESVTTILVSSCVFLIASMAQQYGSFDCFLFSLKTRLASAVAARRTAIHMLQVVLFIALSIAIFLGKPDWSDMVAILICLAIFKDSLAEKIVLFFAEGKAKFICLGLSVFAVACCGILPAIGGLILCTVFVFPSKKMIDEKREQILSEIYADLEGSNGAINADCKFLIQEN